MLSKILSYKEKVLESDLERRSHYLNTILVGAFIIQITFLGILLVKYPPDKISGSGELAELYLALGVILLGTIIAYAVNRRISTDLASAFFLVVFTILPVFSDTPIEVVNGRTLIVFAIPILAASILLRPWASFLFAGLSGIVVILVSLVMLGDFPNLPAIGIFFFLAMISWLYSRNIERSYRSSMKYFEELSATQEKYRVVSELSSDFAYTFFVEPDGSLCPEWATEAFSRVTGYTFEEMQPDRAWEKLIFPEDWPAIQQYMAELRTGQTGAIEFRIVTKDGSIRWLCNNARTIWDAGRVVRMYGAAQNITERKLADERIKAALEEKITLVREVHHRVKNNLQAIIYLIEMKTGQMRDPGTRTFLIELEGQARAMSLVYAQLSDSDNLARVEMATYINRLVHNILESFGSGDRIETILDIAAISLDVARAMPCGLIINELVTNSLKHAYPAGFIGKPVIRVSLQSDGLDYCLSVSDNGIGMPLGFDLASAQTQGLRLVNLWATHQMGGTLDKGVGPGISFLVKFPESSERKS